MKGINVPINFSIVETIIKSTHIFNDICLVSKLYIIKVLPKSNIVVIWVDIWDIQSGLNAECLINRYFNVSNYIAIIQEVNINLKVP